MIEIAYEYGKAQGQSDDPILDLIKDIEGCETTYFIYFDLDNKRIEIESRKFSTKHPEEYLYMDEKKKGHFYSSSTTSISNIIGYLIKTKKDNTKERKEKRTIIESLNKIINDMQYIDKTDFNPVISTIEDTFYSKAEGQFFLLKDDYCNEILKIDGKSNFYVTGYIKNGKKYLLSKLPGYKKLIIEFKFGITKNNQKEGKLFICDFCEKERELVKNFGSSNPYKLNALKMFGSEFIKGFYSIDNSEDALHKTLRCCPDCFKKIQKTDNKLEENHHIVTLRPISIGKAKSNPINLYMFLQSIFTENIATEAINELVISLFGDSTSYEKVLSTIANVKGNISHITDNEENIVINLFFNIGSNNKNQVIHEARNLTVKNIKQIFRNLNFLTEARKLLIPDSVRFFNLRYIFELISLFNYKVSVEVIKSFFHKKVPLTSVVLKGMLKHIRSSIHGSYSEKIAFLYHTLTLDISLLLSFIVLLNKEEYKMEDITKELVLEQYEKKEKEKIKKLFRAKSIKEFVKKVYADITEPEIALMQIGEIIYDITKELAFHNKSDREKVFFSKINYTGMTNTEIENFLVFINSKISQYYMDLKYLKNNLSERLNQITIEINNNNIDKIKAVLRIVDGYNLKNRINILAAISNKEIQV